MELLALVLGTGVVGIIVRGEKIFLFYYCCVTLQAMWAKGGEKFLFCGTLLSLLR